MFSLAGLETSNLLVTLLIFLLTVFAAWSVFFKSSSEWAPCYKGWIPWLGCAVEFGKAPLLFIQRAKDKMGPVFTLYMTGKRMTFVTEPEDFHHFFQSDKVDFQKALQEPVQNVASVSIDSFYQNHTKIHDTVKGMLASSKLKPLSSKLHDSFQEHLAGWGQSGRGDLNQCIRTTMYAAVMDNLFGKQMLPTTTKEMMSELENHFVTFDEDFEYGTQIPDMFLREWSRSKRWLLALFENLIKKLEKRPASNEPKTVFETIVEAVDRKHAPNFSLLMLWASLANAIPMTFWLIAFIVSNQSIYEDVKKELNKALGDGECAISEEHLKKLPLIKRCTLEAIRLRSPGVITRKVITPMKIRDFTVPAGDLLMLSPYWSHHNPRFFPEPEKFLPSRWEKADIEKNVFLEGFVAFGGGRYQCPGRWFALMEIHMFVAMVLHQYDITLLDDVPDPSPLHLVGTQQPVAPCHISYTRKVMK